MSLFQTCSKCGELLPYTQFYTHTKICKSCLNEATKNRFNKKKLKAITYKGGKCSVCGGKFSPAVFEFHHKDPALKENKISKLLYRSWDKVKKELDKTDLVCANCHREIHN